MGNSERYSVGRQHEKLNLVTETIIARCDGRRNLDDPGVVVSDHNIS